jgi:hypothetical protein
MAEPNPQSSLDTKTAPDPRLEWALNRSIIEGSFYTVMNFLIGGVFIQGFALEFGATKFYIGLIAAPMLFLVEEPGSASVRNMFRGYGKVIPALATKKTYFEKLTC